MKMVVAGFLSFAVITAAIRVPTEPPDLQTERSMTLAQQFCPNGRC